MSQDIAELPACESWCLTPGGPGAVCVTERTLFMHLFMAPLRSTRVLSILAALVLVGCSQAKEAPPAPQPPEVSVVTVHRTSVAVTTELPGRTSAHLVAQVRARVDGIVQKLEFNEGGDVRANQRLYQIDPAPYRAALDSAIATLQKAQANRASATALVERYKILIAGNGVSKQDYDKPSPRKEGRCGRCAGKAAVAARITLGYTDVRRRSPPLGPFKQDQQGARTFRRAPRRPWRQSSRSSLFMST